MRVRRLLVAAAVAGTTVALSFAVPVAASPPGAPAPGAHPAPNVHASDRVVYHYDRSASAAHAAKPGPTGSSALMTNHGGKILTTANIHPIFWGTSWGGYAGDKISGIDRWYAGYSNSNYAKTSTEYSSQGQSVGTGTSSLPSTVDTSAASGGGDSAAILGEVAKMFPTPDPSGNGYYPVYTDVPRGSASYCAYHSAGTINGTTVQFAFFWKLDGDGGCDPQSTVAGQSQGLAAIANVTGHELAETMTDPANPGAWYDAQGNENGDKCAWTFGAPSVTFPNGSTWKIQGEWSNAAFLSPKLGYRNSAGQKGCLSGL